MAAGDAVGGASGSRPPAQTRSASAPSLATRALRLVIGALSGGARRENRLDRTRKEESEKARERARAKSPVTREMLLDALKVHTSHYTRNYILSLIIKYCLYCSNGYFYLQMGQPISGAGNQQWTYSYNLMNRVIDTNPYNSCRWCSRKMPRGSPGQEEGKSKPALLPPIQSQAGGAAREASFIEKYVEKGELPGREVRSARSRSKSEHRPASQTSALGGKSPDEAETVTVEPVTGRRADQQPPLELVVDARRDRSAEKQEHPNPGPSTSIRLPRNPIHSHPAEKQHRPQAATLGVPTEGLAGLLRVASAASRSARSAHAPPTEQTAQPGASGAASANVAAAVQQPQLAPAAGELGSEEALAEYIEQNKRRIMSALTRGKVSGEADAAALQLLQEHLKLEAGSIRVELDEPASDASSEFDPNADYYAGAGGGGGGGEWQFAEEGTHTSRRVFAPLLCLHLIITHSEATLRTLLSNSSRKAINVYYNEQSLLCSDRGRRTAAGDVSSITRKRCVRFSSVCLPSCASD